MFSSSNNISKSIYSDGPSSCHSSPSSSLSWVHHRDQGRQQYEDGCYEQALHSFQSALQHSHNDSIDSLRSDERQALLSNIVACRLKLALAWHDYSQANAAIRDAKACIAINPTWSKGYVRLASALITAQSLSPPDQKNINFNSNEACNALQTALRYDPSNSHARKMLLQELRGRDEKRNCSNNDISSNYVSSCSAGPLAQGSNDTPPMNPDYVPPSTSSADTPVQNLQSQRCQSRSNRSDLDGIELDDTDSYHSGSSSSNSRRNNSSGENNTATTITTLFRTMVRYFTEQVTFVLNKWKNWYCSLSPDSQTGLLLVAFLLFAYIVSGGRFGLDKLLGGTTRTGSHNTHKYQEFSTKSMKGNYGAGNAYDLFRKEQQRQRQSQNQQQQNHRQQRASRYNDDEYTNEGHSYRRDQHEPNPNYDVFMSFGGFHNIIMIALVMYMCYRNGIHPINAFMMVNAVNGRGGGGFFRGGGGGFGGMYRRGRYHYGYR